MAIISVYHSCCVDIINCKLTTIALYVIVSFMCFYQARNEERRGNIASAQTKGNISLGLNVAAVVFTIVMWSVVVIPVAVTVSAKSSASGPTPQYCPTQYYCTIYYCFNSSDWSSCQRYYFYAYRPNDFNASTYCYEYNYYYYYYNNYCYYNG